MMIAMCLQRMSGAVSVINAVGLYILYQHYKLWKMTKSLNVEAKGDDSMCTAEKLQNINKLVVKDVLNMADVQVNKIILFGSYARQEQTE